jgi:rod shape-determining protein MreD
MARHPRSRIGKAPSSLQLIGVPIGATMIGSMLPLLPMISTAPLMPPIGLLIFLCWRSFHRTLWPAWMGIPLGFWDDLFSGQVVGSAMMLWTIALLLLDMLDRRMIWRDIWQEWGLAAVSSCVILLLQLRIAHSTGGDTSALFILPQLLMTILLYPLVARLCARIDHWRLTR